MGEVGKLEGDEMLYLFFWNQIMGIDMKKMEVLNGGGCIPDLTPLVPDKLLVLTDEDLPVGMGFSVDGSKIYLAGGESVDRPFYTATGRGEGTSRAMYVADLSDLKFSKIHEFEAIKPPSPLVVKIKDSFLAMTTQNYCRCPPRSYLELYEPDSTKTNTRTRRLPVPPFFKYSRINRAKTGRPFRDKPTGYAVVGDTLCVELVDEFHFFNIDKPRWMTRPSNNCGLLHFLHSNSLLHHLCHGSFVLGCDDVLLSIVDGRLDMLQALLLPPIGSGENDPPVIFYQTFPEVEKELLAIGRHHRGQIGSGMILNFSKDKMCAIFQCSRDEDEPDEEKYIVYIFIFQVSKLSQQWRPDSFPSSSGIMLLRQDFISITPLHKGLYHLNRLSDELPLLSGAFITRDSKAVCYHHIID